MSRPKYWKDLEEYEQSPEFLAEAGKEFSTDLPSKEFIQLKDEDLAVSGNRRDFLKMFGFGVTAATLSACFEAPVKKAIPYVNKPHDIIPGVANWYASTTSTGMPVLVKTREGRPIKLEGNPDSSLTNGGLFAADHATLLNLYEMDRFKSPRKGSNPAVWDTVDREVTRKLEEIRAAGGKVRVLTGSVMSAATKQAVGEFLDTFGDGAHVSYDAVSYGALAKAHEASFGTKAVPSYKMEDADVIVSFAADFLGTWLSPVEFSWKYASNRDPRAEKMSRHFQFESLMSLTGANADLRFPLNPSQIGLALANLYNQVARRLGQPEVPGVPNFEVAMNGIATAASDLVSAQGRSLVLCGVNDVNCQLVAAGINAMLQNYGATIDIANPSTLKQGDDEGLATLLGELERNEISAIFLLDANPVYNSPYAEAFANALPNVDLSVSFAYSADESSRLCKYVTPGLHFLESWDIVQQSATQFSLVQPTINPIYKNRQVLDSFLKWSGKTGDAKSYVSDFVKDNFYNGGDSKPFLTFWNEALQVGVLEKAASEANPSYTNEGLQAAVGALANASAGEGMELVVYEKVSMRDGQFANNPWLQELPDPISRASWTNYVTVPYSYAQENNIKPGDVLRLSADGKEIAAVAFVQPGQALGTLGIALGYGRKDVGRTAAHAEGVDAYPFISAKDGFANNVVAGASISKTGAFNKLPLMQRFNTLYDPAKGDLPAAMGGKQDYDRTEQIIKETALPFYKNPNAKDQHGENPFQKHLKEYQDKKSHLVTLWDSHFKDPETQRTIRWAMAIDLNKCTGCGSCVVSCQTENNIPVVGKSELRNSRDMYWIRLDRYYSGNPDNPDVVHQPMLCQHCDNAPCETVCPVLATVHSKEGLNQMAYNRCVGTRYCANNCPYKVRRFNWLNHVNTDKYKDINPMHQDNKLNHLVLNPDVTVRFRGVMEKCSFCVQRLQEAKLKAKINSNSSLAKPQDGDVKTACQQSCPTGAIVFGDINDKNSEIAKLYLGGEDQDRGYHVIEEVKTLPSIKYMTKVRNRTIGEWEEKEEAKIIEQTYDKA